MVIYLHTHTDGYTNTNAQTHSQTLRFLLELLPFPSFLRMFETLAVESDYFIRFICWLLPVIVVVFVILIINKK